MQCFTYENKYPRTVLWKTYQPPEAKCYKKRKPFIPEPTKNGRPYCPDLTPYPKNILNVSFLRYNPPLESPHREKKMDEMLEHINRVNWTTGQDVSLMRRRKSNISESVHYSLQSTSRAHFRGHKLSAPPLICPNRTYSIGITPCTYPPPCRPAAKHPYTIATYFPELATVQQDDNSACGKTTMPLELPAPYPGPLPKVPHISATGDDTRRTTKVMGRVP